MLFLMLHKMLDQKPSQQALLGSSQVCFRDEYKEKNT